MKINFRRAHLGIPYVVFMILFVLLPLFFILFYAFTNSSGQLSVEPLVNFFTSSAKWRVLFVSFIFGLLNTALTLLIGYPLAMILANKKYNKNAVLVMLFVMPMWINFVLRTWAMRDVLSFLGLSGGEHPELATLLGLTYNYLPFTILPLYSTMLKLDKSQIEASQDLGAGPIRTFTKVILPMTMPGIISAATMVFMPTMTSYVIADILGEGKVTLFGKYIEIYFTQNIWNDGSFLALIMLLLILLSVLLPRLFAKNKVKGSNVW
ncbi:MAG: ABC transporter permease [Bacilli bacterium]